MPYSESVGIVALADDLTGALEVGACFAARGIRSLVTTDARIDAGAPALTIDTRTRHCPACEAGDAVRALADEARRHGIGLLYKKTDSTLRGNIGSEFQALLDTFPERCLVYVPAYPSMGRTVLRGELFVEGKPLAETAFAADPLNPSKQGAIPKLLSRDCRAPIHRAARADELESAIGRAGAGAVIVCDGSDDDDLSAVATVLGRLSSPYLAAGPAGFAGHWIDGLPVPRGWKAPRVTGRSGLVLCGSVHPTSMKQIRHAEQTGLPCFQVESTDADERFADNAAKALTESGWCCVATRGAIPGPPPEVARRLGALTRSVLDRQRVDCLVVFGGDTAAAVVDALGVNTIESHGDLLAGIPLSRFRFQDRQVALVTKAGGFGRDDTVSSIRRCLRQ